MFEMAKRQTSGSLVFFQTYKTILLLTSLVSGLEDVSFILVGYVLRNYYCLYFKQLVTTQNTEGIFVNKNLSSTEDSK